MTKATKVSREKMSQRYMEWAALCELHANTVSSRKNPEPHVVRHLLIQSDMWFARAVAHSA